VQKELAPGGGGESMKELRYIFLGIQAVLNP
jgi:hypothetical protein